MWPRPKLVTLAAALLAGCGTNLSQDEFAVRANLICSEAALLSEPVLEELKQIVPPRELASAYGKFLDEAEKERWPEAVVAARETGIGACASLAEAAAA